MITGVMGWIRKAVEGERVGVEVGEEEEEEEEGWGGEDEDEDFVDFFTLLSVIFIFSYSLR